MSKQWAEKLNNDVELTEEDVLELLNDCGVKTEVRMIVPGDDDYEEYAALFESHGVTKH